MRETVYCQLIQLPYGICGHTIAGRLDVLANAEVAGTLLNERVLNYVSTIARQNIEQ
jgi:hypothetical protein